jgi:hypothetical protein
MVTDNPDMSARGDGQVAWWNDPAALKAEFELYQAVRKRIQSWHSMIYDRISRAEMIRVGRQLNMVKDNTFIFESEEHSAIFMDYLANFSCPTGTTAIERFLKSIDRSKNDNTGQLAHSALAGLRYAILRPFQACPGFGAVCDDMIGQQRLFLMDRGISQTLDVGLSIATAIYPVRQWVMTSGAGLPMPGQGVNGAISNVFKVAGVQFSLPFRPSKKEDTARLVLTMMRIFLMSGGLDHIQYR